MSFTIYDGKDNKALKGWEYTIVIFREPGEDEIQSKCYGILHFLDKKKNRWI